MTVTHCGHVYHVHSYCDILVLIWRQYVSQYPREA